MSSPQIDSVDSPLSTDSQLLSTLANAEHLVSAEIHSAPLVSVVIPTYNRARTIRKALDTALEQTYQNIEIIVVDDGSTDETENVLAFYEGRIRYFKQANQGASAARNRGIREARGKYIAFLDSDDQWLPNKLEKQIALLESQPDLSFVACLSTVEKRTYAGYEDHASQFIRFIVQPFTQNMTRYVVRRDCFEQHGYFDPTLQGPEDWELWLRFLQRGCRFGYVPEPLMIYVSSDDSISSRPYAMLSGEKVIRQRYVSTLPGFWRRLSLGCWCRARSYMNASVCFREEGKLLKCLGYMLASILNCPIGPRNHIRFRTLLVLPKLAVKKLCGTL